MNASKTTIALACIALTATISAQAQTTDPKPAATLGAITITANKVEEKLKDVPQSVTLLTGEEIQDKGIRNVADLIREIPNLSSSFVYSEEVNFRGINASTFTNSNPLVIYVDGIPHSNRYAYDALLENVERVEVLRGPQGSLYGKDALGGVINIVTKSPTNHWSGHVGAEVANQGGHQVNFAVNGPIVKEQLYLTLAGKTAGQDGWIRNNHPGMNPHANRKDEDRFNLGLLYKMSADTQVRFNASRDDQANFWADGGLVPFTSHVASLNRDDTRVARFDQDTYTKTRSNAQSFAVKHKFDGITLDAVTTHKAVKIDGDYDADWGTSALSKGLTQFQHSKIDTVTQEIRLSGGQAGHTRWVGGLYLEKDKYQNTRYGMQYPASAMGNPFGAGVNIDMDDVSNTQSSTQALFGQVMVPVANGLELTVGGRYQKIKKDFDSAFYMLPVGTTGLPPAMAVNGTHRWSVFLPKVALSYDLNPSWKSYVSVAKGYMPGGYNYWTSSSNEADNRFNPQTSTNYEMGVRSDFGQLYLSAALFYMDIKDIHVYSFNRSSGMIYTSNAGKAHSKGAELEANYLVNGNWEISGALGLTNARYDQYSDVSANGNRIEKTPAYTARVGVQYTASQGAYARVDIRAQGKRYFNAENTLLDGAYATVDLRAGYKTGPWDFYAYVRNAADTRYLATAATQNNGTLITFGETRRFGAGVRYTF